MTEPGDYTKRELEMMFKRLEEILKDIREDIKATNTHFEVRLTQLEVEVEQIKSWQTKMVAIGGAIWAAITLVAGTFINKIF